jgi:DNA-binding MarR family transcriptional regulator
MAGLKPLSPAEEELWRAVMRLFRVLRRQLDTDLIRGTGLSASEYTTLMHLAEAPNRELRMTDLANATGLSASRTTRLVHDLQSRGWVTKMASSSDARGNVAGVTSSGVAKLKSASMVHLASVRSCFFDHIDTSAIEPLAVAVSAVAARLQDGSSWPQAPNKPPYAARNDRPLPLPTSSRTMSETAVLTTNHHEHDLHTP